MPLTPAQETAIETANNALCAEGLPFYTELLDILKRAAYELAELPNPNSDAGIVSLRSRTITALRQACPEHYGL